MKKTYVRPTMESEVFVTNAYCGACTDNPQLDTSMLLVDYSASGSKWLATSKYSGTGMRDTAWQDDGTFVTSHTFPASPRVSMTNPHNGQPQWYWRCSCHSGADQYYLEYSANWTEGRGEDAFVLFKETSGADNGLTVGDATSWPDYNYSKGEDLAVAMVSFTNPVVQNS